MNTIELVKYKEKFYLSEIFQSLDVKFSFVNKKGEQVTSPAKCRDFLGDCIWSYKTKKKVKIYGFEYNYKTKRYDTKTLRLSLEFPNTQSKEYFISNFKDIQKLETKYNINPSNIIETQFKNILVIEANKVWQSASWKISLYTYLLKIASYKDKTTLQKPEKEYSKELTDEKLNLLMNKIYIEEDIIPETIGKQHNNTGFITILKGVYNPELSKLLGVI